MIASFHILTNSFNAKGLQSELLTAWLNKLWINITIWQPLTKDYDVNVQWCVIAGNSKTQMLLTRCGWDRLSCTKCSSSRHTACSLCCRLLWANKHMRLHYILAPERSPINGNGRIVIHLYVSISIIHRCILPCYATNNAKFKQLPLLFNGFFKTDYDRTVSGSNPGLLKGCLPACHSLCPLQSPGISPQRPKNIPFQESNIYPWSNHSKQFHEVNNSYNQ